MLRLVMLTTDGAPLWCTEMTCSCRANAEAPSSSNGATVAGAQGVLAGLLAALGIAGLVSFAVVQRTREIGIRMALGAKTGNVIRLVTGQSLRLTAIGLVLGLLMAFGVTRLLSGLLYNVSATDPVVFGTVTCVIVTSALLAGWIPARRAARIDPMEALRYE